MFGCHSYMHWVRMHLSIRYDVFHLADSDRHRPADGSAIFPCVPLRILCQLSRTLMLGKIDGRKRKGQQRMRWLGGNTDSRDMNLSKLRQIVKESLACYSSWVCKELDVTE